jgi:VWFA-related protein
MVFHFDNEVEMLCGLDGPGKVLANAVHRIRPAAFRGTPGRSTALYDAIVEAAKPLQAVTGRKAILLLTDGLDVGSQHTLDEAVEAAQRSDTAVYTILVSPAMLVRSSRYHPAPLVPSKNQALIQQYKEMNLTKGRAALLKIAMQTGASSFEATLSRSVKAIYEAMTEELRNQYRIGLACTEEACGPGYHSLSPVTLNNRYKVNVRQGFFAGELPVRTLERICESGKDACTEISPLVRGYAARDASATK